jgi:acetyltransferase-like isoleucine patch superfamily enzyme
MDYVHEETGGLNAQHASQPTGHGGLAEGRPDSLPKRLARVLELLEKFWPAFNARWRLRHATALDGRITLRGRPRVVNQGRMTFGDRVRLDSTVATLELVTLPGGYLEIGNNVFINYGTSLVSSARVKVGDDCLIGTHVMLMDCDFHRVEDKAWDTSGKPIMIEERVWLGNRSIVLKGVTIGHDAVVAAGAVVTRDVPPRTVVAGVPAHVVRHF